MNLLPLKLGFLFTCLFNDATLNYHFIDLLLLEFPPGVNVTDSLTIYKSPIQPQRNIRELPRETPLKAQETQCSCPNKSANSYNLTEN